MAKYACDRPFSEEARRSSGPEVPLERLSQPSSVAAHAERIAAGERAYATLERAVTAVIEQAGGAEADVRHACLGAWAVAHGLAKLLVEGGLDPTRYGVAGSEELVQLALRRMRVSLTAGAG